MHVCICYFPLYYSNHNMLFICIEHYDALLHSRASMVRDILRPIFEQQLHQMEIRTSMIQSSLVGAWRLKLNNPFKENTASLPIVPDVAIHYRCGDNIVGHYGFLSFPAFKNRIPHNSSTIYVMAENPNRKVKGRRRHFCDVVLNGLFSYLTRLYPLATVVVLRGANMYDDFTRLALAQTTICSVSSFCLWPALASTTTAYFPITRLIAKATTPRYHDQFHWLDKFPAESVLLGQKTTGMSGADALNALQRPRGYRPSPPSYVLDQLKLGKKY